MNGNNIRYKAIDGIRGIAIINMIIYHIIWDLVYILGLNVPFFHTTNAYLWQQLICGTFIFLSGFSFSFSTNKLKRGIIYFGLGVLITIITLIFTPQSKIIFGILTLIGSCIIIVKLLENKLSTCLPINGLIISIFAFLLTKNISLGYLGNGSSKIILPTSWYCNLFTTYLGLPYSSFSSADYFGLLPWLFLFVTGYFTYKLIKQVNLMSKLEKSKIKPLEWIGKNSIKIYLIHQPILYLICLLV